MYITSHIKKDTNTSKLKYKKSYTITNKQRITKNIKQNIKHIIK